MGIMTNTPETINFRVAVEDRAGKTWSSDFNKGVALKDLSNLIKIDDTNTEATITNNKVIQKISFLEGDGENAKIPARQLGAFMRTTGAFNKFDHETANSKTCEVTPDVTFEPGKIIITYTIGGTECDAASFTDAEIDTWRKDANNGIMIFDTALGCIKEGNEALCHFGYHIAAGAKDYKDTLKFWGELGDGEDLPLVEQLGEVKDDQLNMTPKLSVNNHSCSAAPAKAEGVQLSCTNTDTEKGVIVYFSAKYALKDAVEAESWSMTDDKYLTFNHDLLDSSKDPVFFSNTGGSINGGNGWLIWVIVGGVVVLAAVAILAYNKWGRATVDDNEEEE